MRFYIRALFACVAVLAAHAAVAQTWTPVISDTFNRASTTVGAAGSTTGVGNGWIDQAGGEWNIVGDMLNGVNASYSSGGLVRPVGEAVLNQRVAATFTLNGNGTNVAVMARTQNGVNSFYMADFEYTSGTAAQASMYSIINGGPNGCCTGGGLGPSYIVGFPAVTVGHSYTLDLSVTGSGPTTISYTVTDNTAGISHTFTGTDNTTGLQSAGVAGVTFFGGARAATYTAVKTYVESSPAPTLTLSPASSSVNSASSVVSITPTLTNSTAALVATVSGGGTVSTASPTSGTAFTYTSPSSGSGTATVTVTDATDGLSATSTISYAPTPPALSLSPASLVGGSANNTVTVTGSGINLTGATFTISGGLGSAIVSQTINSSTSATLVVNPGVAGYGALTVTSSTGPTASLAVTTPSLGTINLLVIGDSIAAGTNGVLVPNLVSYLQGLGYTVTASNQAIGGTGMVDWPVGTPHSYITSAITSAGSGITDVLIELGTNDPRTPNNLTPQQHNAGMRSIIKTLLASYPTAHITIQHPLWTVPNSGAGTANAWPNDPNAWYDQAWKLDLGLVDGVHVFAGDTTSYTMAMLNPTTYLGDGIHPAPGIYNQLFAQFWAVGILKHYGSFVARQSYQ